MKTVDEQTNTTKTTLCFWVNVEKAAGRAENTSLRFQLDEVNWALGKPWRQPVWTVCDSKKHRRRDCSGVSVQIESTCRMFSRLNKQNKQHILDADRLIWLSIISGSNTERNEAPGVLNVTWPLKKNTISRSDQHVMENRSNPAENTGGTESARRPAVATRYLAWGRCF